MKYIELTQGKQAVVDDIDFERVMQWMWCYDGVYAMGYPFGVKMRLHRYIMGARKGDEIDHINRNKLDNRKSNLRFCTHAFNSANRALDARNKSGYTGVSWNKGCRKWTATLHRDYKTIYLGLYETPEEASKARSKYLKSLVAVGPVPSRLGKD